MSIVLYYETIIEFCALRYGQAIFSLFCYLCLFLLHYILTLTGTESKSSTLAMCERKQIGYGDGDRSRKRLKKTRPDRYDVSLLIRVLICDMVNEKFSK